MKKVVFIVSDIHKFGYHIDRLKRLDFKIDVLENLEQTLKYFSGDHGCDVVIIEEFLSGFLTTEQISSDFNYQLIALSQVVPLLQEKQIPFVFLKNSVHRKIDNLQGAIWQGQQWDLRVEDLENLIKEHFN